MKISECVELFLSFIEDKSPNTVKNYRVDLKQFIEVVGDKDISLVSKVDIAKFRMILQSKKKKSSTIARKLAAVNSLFEYLIDMELITSSPVSKSLRPKISQKVPSPLNDEEIKKIIDNAETLMDRLIITVMLTTGLRSSEMLNIKVKDITLLKEGKTSQILSVKENEIDEETVAFIKVRGKGDKERVVPVSGKVLKLLIKYISIKGLKEEDILFPISYKTLWKRIKNIGEKTGIKLHPHKLRHTAATKALQLGSELRVIQELLGHSSPVTTARYAKVNQKQLVNATKKITENIDI